MAPDDRSLGEIGRGLDRLRDAVDRMNVKLDALPGQFVPRETWEIAQGSNRVDIGTLTTQMAALDKKMDEAESEAARRFRSNVVFLITSLLAPIVVALVVIWLSAGLRP
jgi:hypothetical protein